MRPRSRALPLVLVAAVASLTLGTLGAPGSAGAAADTTPPSTPQNLRVTSQSPTAVSLAWDASTDNVGVTAYLVIRDGTRIGRVQAP